MYRIEWCLYFDKNKRHNTTLVPQFFFKYKQKMRFVASLCTTSNSHSLPWTTNQISRHHTLCTTHTYTLFVFEPNKSTRSTNLHVINPLILIGHKSIFDHANNKIPIHKEYFLPTSETNVSNKNLCQLYKSNMIFYSKSLISVTPLNGLQDSTDFHFM